jgi:sulfane dehydrogenase subunit SoxC
MANTGRRNFLRNTAALTGALAGGASAAPLQVPPTNREPGRIIEETAYGVPSKYEEHVKRRRTDVLKNRQNL